MTPNAIAEHFDTRRQAISKHLRVLTECELVKQEQQDREIYYQLEIDKRKEIDKGWNNSGRFGKAVFNNSINFYSLLKRKNNATQFSVRLHCR